MFGATAVDAARTGRRQTFPSEPGCEVTGRHNGGEKRCAYVIRINDENDDIYAAAISFPG